MHFRKISANLFLSGLLLVSGCTSTPKPDATVESGTTQAETTAVISADFNYEIDVPTSWEKSSKDLQGANLFKAALPNMTLEFTAGKASQEVVPDEAALKSFNELQREDFDTDKTATLESEGPTTVGGQNAYYVTWSWGSKKQYKTTRTNTYYKGHRYIIQTTVDITSPQTDLDALKAMEDSIKFL